jgi:hypothetical protein
MEKMMKVAVEVKEAVDEKEKEEKRGWMNKVRASQSKYTKTIVNAR